MILSAEAEFSNPVSYLLPMNTRQLDWALPVKCCCTRRSLVTEYIILSASATKSYQSKSGLLFSLEQEYHDKSLWERRAGGGKLLKLLISGPRVTVWLCRWKDTDVEGIILPKDVELCLGHKPTPWKAEWVTNKKKRFNFFKLFAHSPAFPLLYKGISEMSQSCGNSATTSQKTMRIILTHVSISCFLHFPLLCFFFFDLEQTSLYLQFSLFQRNFTQVLEFPHAVECNDPS